MRIISQDGTLDIPYERKCIGITQDGYIIAHDDICMANEEALKSVIAKYSSREIALEVMDSLRNLYTLGSKTVRFPTEEEFNDLLTK